MRHPGNKIRIASAQALSGIYSAGELVRVYDLHAAANATFPRIILQSIGGPTSLSRFTKCQFGGDWSQNILVSNYYPLASRIDQSIIEDIVNDVLIRLVPFTGVPFGLLPEFSLWDVNGSVVNTNNYADSTGQYVDTIIRITYSLTEN